LGDQLADRNAQPWTSRDNRQAQGHTGVARAVRLPVAVDWSRRRSRSSRWRAERCPRVAAVVCERDCASSQPGAQARHSQKLSTGNRPVTVPRSERNTANRRTVPQPLHLGAASVKLAHAEPVRQVGKDRVVPSARRRPGQRGHRERDTFRFVCPEPKSFTLVSLVAGSTMSGSPRGRVQNGSCTTDGLRGG